VSRSRGPSTTLPDGSHFYFADPRPEDFEPEQLAAALSRIRRWVGRSNWSVAQHCVVVSQIVPDELALTGLLHDAAEAFTGDLPTPLKILLDDAYREIEDGIDAAIAERFGTRYPFPPDIKRADLIACATEIRDEFDGAVHLPRMPDPLPDPIDALPPRAAERAWLRRFRELTS
jgi:uncharacterized protein